MIYKNFIWPLVSALLFFGLATLIGERTYLSWRSWQANLISTLPLSLAVVGLVLFSMLRFCKLESRSGSWVDKIKDTKAFDLFLRNAAVAVGLNSACFFFAMFLLWRGTFDEHVPGDMLINFTGAFQVFAGTFVILWFSSLLEL